MRATAMLTTAAARMYRIERSLRHGQSLSSAELCARNSVSLATFKRDLEALRSELGAPIEYDPSTRRYCMQAWRGVAATIAEQLECAP